MQVHCRLRQLVAASAVIVAVACGDDDTGLSVAKTATNSGDDQTGLVSQELAQPLRVIVLDAAGDPVNGIVVTWATGEAGSALDPATSSTDLDGIASTSWTLGTDAGDQEATASVNGASGSPVVFTAVALGFNPVVTISNNAFTPSAVNVTAGGSVTFVWGTGALNHTVTPDAGNPSALPSSPPDGTTAQDAPFSFDVTFPAAGTYDFFCSVHGAMTGTVTVN